MDTAKLENVHEKLNALLSKGEVEEARKYFAEVIETLPEDVRGELITRMFVDALETSSQEKKDIAQLQKEGLETIKKLENLKEGSE
jgi:predicted transcriptional regulator YheO